MFVSPVVESLAAPSKPSGGAAQPHALLLLLDEHFTWLGLLTVGKCQPAAPSTFAVQRLAQSTARPQRPVILLRMFTQITQRRHCSILDGGVHLVRLGDTLITCSCLLLCCSHLCRTGTCCAISSSRNPGLAWQGLQSSQPSPVVGAAPTQA